MSQKQIIIAYIPVLHRGYQEFFSKYQGEQLYLLNKEELINFEELEYLKKDIRVLDLELAVKSVKSWNVFNVVKPIELSEIENLIYSDKVDEDKDNFTQFVFTDDDTGHFIADKFFKNVDEKYFEPIFLRWDKNLMSSQNEVPTDVVISSGKFEQETMIKAFGESGKSSDWWRHVGGAIVKEGQVVLAGFNQHLPVNDQQYKNSDPRIPYSSGVGAEFSSSIHAEANLIATAAKRGLSLEGAEIYATTFPCPVCAKQIAVAGIKKVYYAKGYAVLDGLEILKSYGVEIVLVKFDQDKFKEIEKMEQDRSRVKDCYVL